MTTPLLNIVRQNNIRDNTHIVCFTGNGTGSGKDTCFEYFQEYIQDKLPCRRFAMADDMKERLADFLSSNFCVDRSDVLQEMHTVGIKENYREVFRFLGNFGRTRVTPDFWVYNLIEAIYAQNNQVPNIVCITDLRFDNEIEALKRRFTHVTVYKVFSSIVPPIDVISEKGINPSFITKTFKNISTLEYLKAQVTDAAKDMMETIIGELGTPGEVLSPKA